MSPVAPTLPAGTALGFSYEYGVDINLGTVGAPNWQPIRRPSAISPKVTPITADVQSYDDFGAPNEDKISESFSLSFTVLDNRSAATGLSLPEIEKLDSYTKPGVNGADAVAHVRWYHKPSGAVTPNPGDAFEGLVTVAIERGNTGNADPGTWSVTLTGKGTRTQIANPYAGQVPAVPTVTGATPSGAAAGEQVVITGTGFLGTTLVKFAAVTATVFQVIGGSTIVAVMPAGTAGSAAVTVTNATGLSNALPYTRA